ncbi:MAG: hypothetical protein L0271_15625, partial [Gemmatimonadetes bacterium]|nr:hypothetical protein [Gemmatimonadota bacterium]
MRVREAAREFRIDGEKLLQLLHAMGVRVTSQASRVDDDVIARLRARFERERRAGHGGVEESFETVMEDTVTSGPRRRRRRKADIEAVEEEARGADAEADVGEAPLEAHEIAAEAEFEAAPVAGTEPDEVSADVELEPEPEPVTEAPGEEPAFEPAIAAEADTTSDRPAQPRTATPDQRPRLRRAAEVLGRFPPQRPAAATPAPAASAGPGGQVRIQAEGFTTDGRRKKDKRKKKARWVDQDAVQENVARVLSELRSGGKKRRQRRDEAPSRVELEAERQRRA